MNDLKSARLLPRLRRKADSVRHRVRHLAALVPIPSGKAMGTVIALIVTVATLVTALQQYHVTSVIELQRHEFEARHAYLQDLARQLKGVPDPDAMELVRVQQESARLTWLLAIHKHLGHNTWWANAFFHPARDWDGRADEELEFRLADQLKKDLHARTEHLIVRVATTLQYRPDSISNTQFVATVDLLTYSAINVGRCCGIKALLAQLNDEATRIGQRYPGPAKQLLDRCPC